MKKIIGFLILIIVLVAVSGCTQQTSTPPATTTAPAAPATTIATTVETTVPVTTETTTNVSVAETAAVTNATATVTETPVKPVPTAIVTAGMTPSTKVTVVHITNNSFSPSVLMVLPGTGISWVNDDSTVHSVKTIGKYQGKFNSGDISPTVKWSYSFGDAEGTFEYADGYNMNVTGVIIVKNKEIATSTLLAATPGMTSNATW